MESINEIYSSRVEKTVYLFFISASLIANIAGAISNVIIFGFSVTTIVIFSFVGVALISLLVAKIFNSYIIPISIGTAIIISLEFPFVFFSYREAAIPYFILGLYGATALYKGKFKYAMISALVVIYTLTVVFTFLYPSFYENVIKTAGSITILISACVATVITCVTIVATVSLVLHNYKILKDEYVELNARLERINHYDSLTLCYNRKFLMNYLEENSTGRNTSGLTIIIFSLIDLEYANSKFGSTTGDECLVQFADIAYSNLKGRGFLARYEGKRFAAVVNITSNDEINKTINSIIDDFNAYFNDKHKEAFSIAYGFSICKNKFNVNDELKIANANCDDMVESQEVKVFESDNTENNELQ